MRSSRERAAAPDGRPRSTQRPVSHAPAKHSRLSPSTPPRPPPPLPTFAFSSSVPPRRQLVSVAASLYLPCRPATRDSRRRPCVSESACPSMTPSAGPPLLRPNLSPRPRSAERACVQEPEKRELTFLLLCSLIAYLVTQTPSYVPYSAASRWASSGQRRSELGRRPRSLRGALVNHASRRREECLGGRNLSSRHTACLSPRCLVARAALVFSSSERLRRRRDADNRRCGRPSIPKG